MSAAPPSASASEKSPRGTLRPGTLHEQLLALSALLALPVSALFPPLGDELPPTLLLPLGAFMGEPPIADVVLTPPVVLPVFPGTPPMPPLPARPPVVGVPPVAALLAPPVLGLPPGAIVPPAPVLPPVTALVPPVPAAPAMGAIPPIPGAPPVPELPPLPGQQTATDARVVSLP